MSFSSYILSKCFRVFTIVKSVWFRKRKKNFNRVSTLKLICHHLSMWHHFSVYHLHVSTNFYASPLRVSKFLYVTSICHQISWLPLRVTKFLCVNKFQCVTSTCHQIPMFHLYFSQISMVNSMCHPISTCHQISMCHIYNDVFGDSFRVQLPNSHQLTFTSSIKREGVRNCLLSSLGLE